MLNSSWINVDGSIKKPDNSCLFDIEAFDLENIRFTNYDENLFNNYNDYADYLVQEYQDFDYDLYINDNKSKLLLMKEGWVLLQPIDSSQDNDTSFVGRLIAKLSEKLVDRDEESIDLVNLSGANPLFPSLKQNSSNELISTVRFNDTNELKYVFNNGSIFDLDGDPDDQNEVSNVIENNNNNEVETESIFDILTESQLNSVKAVLRLRNLSIDDENVEHMAKVLNLI